MQTPRTGYTEPPPTPTPTPGYDARSVPTMFDVIHVKGMDFALGSQITLLTCRLSHPTLILDVKTITIGLTILKIDIATGSVKKTFKKLLAYSCQAYDTYDQAIGNYYGLSFEMAREFCQVKILNRSPSICNVVVSQLLLPILFSSAIYWGRSGQPG